MPKVNPLISYQSSEFFSNHFRSRNAGCEYALNSWPMLFKRTLKQTKKRFSPSELKLIIDTFNGTILPPGLAGQHLEVQVVDSIELDGNDKKWKINGKDLIGKINKLSLFESACLEVWAKGFWYAERSNNLPDFEDYIDK
jgi:hypothetical protein